MGFRGWGLGFRVWGLVFNPVFAQALGLTAEYAVTTEYPTGCKDYIQSDIPKPKRSTHSMLAALAAYDKLQPQTQEAKHPNPSPIT